MHEFVCDLELTFRYSSNFHVEMLEQFPLKIFRKYPVKFNWIVMAWDLFKRSPYKSAFQKETMPL